MAKNDETDLVDVKELPSDEDVTEARNQASFGGRFNRDTPELSATDRDSESGSNTENDGEDSFAMQMERAKPGQTTVASLRERLAAFLVDMGVLWLLFWGSLFAFHKVTTHSWIGPIPTQGNVAIFFHGSFLLLAFLYFFLLESAFFSTIGKFFCWMYVRRKDGRHAGIFSIFIRNFFRLIELLTAGLLTWVPMEMSRRHQRFGDMAAGTIVIKKHSANTRYYGLDAELLASAFGRTFAQVVDLALVLVWLAGYVILIDYQSTIVSQWLVLLFPVVTILFWTLVQVVLETTPGLWLLGYTITHEDGGRLTLAGALLRVLLSPIDLFLGLPCMLLSLRKQKVGDLMGATVVTCQPRRWKGAIGSLVVIALSVGLFALGLFINPLNNVFKSYSEFKLSFMPTVEGLPGWESATAATPQVLTLSNFRFGVNDPNTRRTPPVYEPGEIVYLLFEITGYTRMNRMVWIQEDLMVQYPNGTIGLKQENVVDYHQIMKPGGGQIELTNNVALPPTAAPGTYVVTVSLRDMLAEKYTLTETQSFTVKEPPSMTSPLEALPPAPPTPSPLPVEPYGTPPPSAPAGEIPSEATEPVPTVPSSPLPVMPTAPASPAAPPSTAPTDGFTVLPGPSLAPKQEVVPVPSIPVPPPTVPSDLYGSKAVAPIVPAPVPAPSVPVSPPATPPAPASTPAITEKTLTPMAPPTDRYGAVTTPLPPPTPAPPPAAPTDAYAKPAAPVTTAPAAAPTAAPTTPPKTEPATQVKAKAVPKVAKPVAPKPATKPAEKEATQAKPAADIPSASAVKAQAEQDAATSSKPKKKKRSSGGGSSGGYMP